MLPEAVETLLNRAFRDLTSIRYGVHYDGNTRSTRMCGKCGFQYHHTHLNVISPLGDLRTEHCYLLTRCPYDKSQTVQI